jgi:hypothetical protein
MDFNKLSRKYFDVWNTHNIEELSSLFSKDSCLRDWNINVSNKKNVLDANQKIFDDVPNISAEIVNLHISEKTMSVSAEIIVHIDDNTKIKVVDIITFNSEGLIKSIRAYQG